MDSEPGDGRFEGVGKFLQGDGPVGVAVWGGDVGPCPEDGAVPGHFSKQGREEDHQEAAPDTYRWELGIPASGVGTEGSGVQGDKKVGYKEAEHGCAIYCDTTNYGTL